MCGIVGFWDKRGRLDASQKQTLISQMTVCLEHRGRDDSGTDVSGAVATGHARLSILDLSKNGAQPFFDDAKTLVLAYNGEVYNYRALNQDLERRHKLRSSCDTETILVGYQDEGNAFIPKLNGMFAYSLYDIPKNLITLAVDRFAIKPIYYLNTPDWFAWSSEVKSLLLLPGVTAQVNANALWENIVFKQIYGGATLFKDIYRMMPAEKIEIDLTTARLQKDIYWRLKKHHNNTNDFEAELEKRLDNSVSDHLLADVPVGVQLSGGVDSSLVTALAARHKSNLNTYSIGLKDAGWNEFDYSRAVAERYQTNHHELLFTPEDFCQALPRLTYFHDEPIGHSHSVPMFLLAQAARQDVKVLLSGEGADEVFFGYKRYASLFKNTAQQKETVFSNAFIDKHLAAQVLQGSSYDQSLTPRVELASSLKSLPWVEQISQYDLQTYLPPLLLRQDKMGMAANLENRVPFLDYQLVEFGYSLPENLKIDAIENKILLKKVASKYLPANLIYRPKVGFGQPIGAWLKDPAGLGRFLQLFKDERRDYLNYQTINALAADHLNNNANNAEILWVLITLELWARIFIDGKKPDEVL